MGNFYKNKALPIIVQDKRIQERFPKFVRKNNYKEGIWIGDLQPTEWSNKYKIQIKYKVKQSPKVTVISPELLLAKGKNQLPHVYSKNELCLFHPKKEEWTPSHFIADTIIPWTSLWLFFYEDWLYTGQWIGGGEHPNEKRQKRKKNRIKI